MYRVTCRFYAADGTTTETRAEVKRIRDARKLYLPGAVRIVVEVERVPINETVEGWSFTGLEKKP